MRFGHYVVGQLRLEQMMMGASLLAILFERGNRPALELTSVGQVGRKLRRSAFDSTRAHFNILYAWRCTCPLGLSRDHCGVYGRLASSPWVLSSQVGRNRSFVLAVWLPMSSALSLSAPSGTFHLWKIAAETLRA